MNERIKLLAKQAGCKVMDDGEWYIPSATGLEKIVYTSGVGLEKFAELIVRECAGLFPNVYVEIENEYGHTPVIAADYIKKHFGVEQ